MPVGALTDPEVLQAIGGIGSFLAMIRLLIYAAIQVADALIAASPASTARAPLRRGA